MPKYKVWPVNWTASSARDIDSTEAQFAAEQFVYQHWSRLDEPSEIDVFVKDGSHISKYLVEIVLEPQCYATELKTTR
jgi:hypothetical protein